MTAPNATLMAGNPFVAYGYHIRRRDICARYYDRHQDRKAASNARWLAQQPPEYALAVGRLYRTRHPDRVAARQAHRRETGRGCWYAMLDRCLNPNHKSYHNYGGRGVAVSWRYRGPNGHKNLIADIGERPSLRHTLDRYPNNETGSYVPGNIRWALPKQQRANQRTTSHV